MISIFGEVPSSEAIAMDLGLKIKSKKEKNVTCCGADTGFRKGWGLGNC